MRVGLSKDAEGCIGYLYLFKVKLKLYFFHFRDNPLLFGLRLNQLEAPFNRIDALSGHSLQGLEVKRTRDAGRVAEDEALFYFVEFAEVGSVDTEPDDF